MLDARIAIIILGSLATIIGVAVIVSLFTAWATGVSALDILNSVMSFLYKMWDTILMFFQTLTHAAPAIIKILIFTGLFWVFGNFLISSTIGVTHACSDGGQLYNLGYWEGIGYQFLPEDFNKLYYIEATNEVTLSQNTGGFLGIGTKRETMRGIANFVQDETFVVPAGTDQIALFSWLTGGSTTAWQSKESNAFADQDPYRNYPMKEFSICRKINQVNIGPTLLGIGNIASFFQGKNAGISPLAGIVGDEQPTGECFLFDGYCEALNLGFKSQIVTAWRTKYGLRYYQGNNATQLQYEIHNYNECGAGAKIIKLPFNGKIVLDCSPTLDAIDFNKCMVNNNFTTTWRDSQGNMMNISGSDPLHYIDATLAIYNANGSLVRNTSGRIYNVDYIPLRGAEGRSASGGSAVRTLFKSDGITTFSDSKENFLLQNEDKKEVPNKKNLVYWDCVPNKEKDKFDSEIFIARFPVFSLKFVLMLVVFTMLFAFIGFLNSLRRK